MTGIPSVVLRHERGDEISTIAGRNDDGHRLFDGANARRLAEPTAATRIRDPHRNAASGTARSRPKRFSVPCVRSGSCKISDPIVALTLRPVVRREIRRDDR
jgi:hypothetical protein